MGYLNPCRFQLDKIELRLEASKANPSRIQTKEYLMSSNTVRVKKKENIGTLMLNRPEIMNALNDEMVMALAAAIDQVALDEDIKVLVIKGSGQHFSSGADMNLLDQDIAPSQWLKGMRVFGIKATNVAANKTKNQFPRGNRWAFN